MNAASPITARRRWSALLVLFIAQMCSVGLVSYGYGLLIKPLSEEFGLSRAAAGNGLQLWLLGAAIWSPLVGMAVQKWAPHLVIAAGALLFGSGMVIAASSDSLPISAVATFLLIASGAAALGPIAGSSLIARWFPTGQGRALGIITVSASAGGFVLVPLLASSMEQFGWRSTVLAAGLFVGATTLILAYTVLRELPGPPVKQARGSFGDTAIVRPLGAREILATRDFWLLVLAIGTMLGLTQGILTSIIPHGQDQGLSAERAAYLISVVSVSAVTGKLVAGWLSERFDPRWLQIGVVGLMASFLLIILAHPPFSLMLLACMFAGGAIGGNALLWVVLVSTRFGVGAIGPVLGFMMPMLLPFQLGSIQFVGVMFDRWQSYAPAYTSFLFFLPLVALGVLPVRGSRKDVASDKPDVPTDRVAADSL